MRGKASHCWDGKGSIYQVSYAGFICTKRIELPKVALPCQEGRCFKQL
jgi:hypothetical protein